MRCAHDVNWRAPDPSEYQAAVAPWVIGIVLDEFETAKDGITNVVCSQPLLSLSL